MVCNKCGSLKTTKVMFVGAPANFDKLGEGEKPKNFTCKRTFLECASCGAGLGTFKVYGSFEKSEERG